MDKMTIDINLSGQEEGKHRTLYLVLGICGLVFIGITLAFPDFRPTYLIWIPLIPSIVQSMLYGLGKSRTFGDNFPYLRVNEERIETFRGGFLGRPTIYYWKDAKSVDVKLFAIDLTLTDGQMKSVNLENLTDDNLRLVKDYVSTIKKKFGV